MSAGALLFLTLSYFILIEDVKAGSKSSLLMMDPQKKLNLVDESFIDQKDVLLDMLESKLKEVRDKKKSKKERGATNNNHNNGEGPKCDPLPKNMDIKYKASGISGVGELDLSLRFGSQGNFTLWDLHAVLRSSPNTFRPSTGKGSINFDATGISNVGKAHLDLGVGEGGFNLPGLSQLFARSSNVCNLTNSSEAKNGNKEIASDAKNNSKLLEVQPLVTAGNESDDTRRNIPQNASDTNVNSTTLIPSTGTTSVTWEIIPTTSTAANNTTNAADNNTIQQRANDNSTKTQNDTVPLVDTGSNSTVVGNTNQGSNSTTTK